jgi:hypothetical protein
VWAALYGGDDDHDVGHGETLIFSTGRAHLAQWSAFEAADEAFGVGSALGCTKKICAGDVAQRYFQPAERFNMSLYPDGWQQPQEEERAAAASPLRPPRLLPSFRPAVQRAAGAFADGLAIKTPMPLTLRQQLPLRFLSVTRSGGGGGSDAAESWSYIVDFGCNFQGGLNVSFATPSAVGRVISVQTGETLCPNGSVAHYITRTKVKQHGGRTVSVDHICQRSPHEDVLNNWTSQWVLRGAGGDSSSSSGGGGAEQRQRIETHE